MRQGPVHYHDRPSAVFTSTCPWPSPAIAPDAGAAERLLLEQDAELNRRFFFARLLISLGVGGYVAATAVVAQSTAPLLGVVATYALANLGVFLILTPLPGQWVRWSFAALDVAFVLLLRYSPFLRPFDDPNVTMAGLLALLVVAYTLYGDTRLTPTLALGTMAAAGAVVWRDAVAALQTEAAPTAVHVYSLHATAIMGYLAIAAIVSLGLVLTIRAQRRRHGEAVEAQLEASVQAAVERARRERVEELDQMKLSFIGVLSHELRTPITPLTSALDLLREDLHALAAEPDSHEMLDIAREAAAQLERLVQDYTRLAELLTSDADADVPHNVALDSLIEAMLENRSFHGVQVDGLSGLTAAADARLLTGALTALLRRAELATEGYDDVVHVYGEQHAHHVSLSIHDAHSHIDALPADGLDDLFSSNSERVFHSASTGLELILARHSLRRLGGQLEVTSTPEDGTTVTCLLPLSQPEQPLIGDAEVALVLQVMG